MSDPLDPFLRHHLSQLGQVRQWASMLQDPALNRGYRIGDDVEVAANAGVGGVPRTLLVQHGQQQLVRWKVILRVEDLLNSVPAGQNNFVRFHIENRAENELIRRQVSVSVGQATYLYVIGRSVKIEAENQIAGPLTVHYQLDEEASGIARWRDVQFVAAIPVGAYELVIPPFCTSFTLLATDTDAITLEASIGATLLYRESITGPTPVTRSVIPGARYTITPGAGDDGVPWLIIYDCLG